MRGRIKWPARKPLIGWLDTTNRTRVLIIIETRRFQSKDLKDLAAITEILKEECGLRKEPFDEKVWNDYLKKRDATLAGRMGTILAVDGGTIAGFVLAEIRNEITGREYGYVHLPQVKREFKTKCEELLYAEAIKHLRSLKLKEIRTMIPASHQLMKSVVMKLHFQQFVLEWQLLG